MPDRTSAPMSFRPAASTLGGTTPNGITAACRMRPAFRSAGRAPSTRSPRLVCFWSATTAASSPARPSTSTAASAFTEVSPATPRSGRRSLRIRSNFLDHLVAFVALGAVAGGFVQGLSGFACGLTAMAIWAWSIEPMLAGPLVAFGTLFGQLLSIRTVRSGLDARLIWPFVAGGILGVPLGVALLPHLDLLAFKLGVGLLLLVWCPAMLVARKIPRITGGGRLADGFVGWIGGIMCGIAGLNGPAPTLWTTLRGWERDRQRAVFQTFSLVTQTLTIAAYLATGIIEASTAWLFAVMVPAMLIPTLVGARLYRSFTDAGFRRIVLGLLALSGAILVATSVPAFFWKITEKYRWVG